jgi:Bacterial regulatory proteins, lacI family
MPHKTTATRVAKAAGVSPATVDRVLNGRGVSAEKERRVLEWTQKLGPDRNLRLRPARSSGGGWRAHRLCRPAELCRDARLAVDRPLARHRLVRSTAGFVRATNLPLSYESLWGW